jgi:hypothetical protein
VSAAGGRDRDAFVALVLGIVAGGRRLHDGLDAALHRAAVLPSARGLETRDYAVLGLLAFTGRIEELVATLDSAAPPNAPAAAPAAAAVQNLLR